MSSTNDESVDEMIPPVVVEPKKTGGKQMSSKIATKVKATQKGAATSSKKKLINSTSDGQSKNRRSTKRYISFSTYIHRVLRQVHPDITITTKSILIMNSFINDLFERLAQEASRLVRYNKVKTLGVREMQTAVRLLMPGELNKHAVSEATKAVTKYKSNE